MIVKDILPALQKRSVDVSQYPLTAQNSRLATFESYKLGWFIHWNMPTYDGEEVYLINGQQDANSPTAFSYAGSSVASWANDAESAGNVDYAYLTTKHQIGFQLYPNSIQYNGGSQITGYTDSYRSGLSIPYYQNYHVNSPLLSGVQQDIIGEYISTFKAKGIEPGLYYNIGKDINIRAGFNDESPSAFDDTGNYRDYWAEWKLNGIDAANTAYPSITGTYSQYYRAYIDYVKAHITHLMSNFDVNLLWFDAVAWYPRVALRELYELVKTIRPNCLVTMNVPTENAGSGLTLKPNGTITNPPYTVDSSEIYLFQGGKPACDIICYEESRISSVSSDWGAQTIHNGNTYYIPKEVCAHSLTNKWFWNTGSSTMRSDLQALYNNVASKGMRLNLAMSPMLDGVLPSNQVSAVSAINTN